MKDYNFAEIESRIQGYWQSHQVYKVSEDSTKQPYYVLDMFPYPSGAGLHVGHPLGYIASDIVARYKRHRGFNVLHPMGFDSFGLPAEQYAIQTGQHPEKTTRDNVARYREQLDKIGFSYDWDREIRTSDPEYYRWTQWCFIKLFESYYDTTQRKARPISDLIQHFEIRGTDGITAVVSEELHFTADAWKSMSLKEQSNVLMNYRLAYQGDSLVNWCPALGTVLANDEVSEGLSVRGGHPVEQRKMRQWCLRVSAYAERLLDDLETLDWTPALKEMQRNWIGRSEGAELNFHVDGADLEFTVFTTRADTVYGVSFVVLAPESELVELVTRPRQQEDVANYLEATKKRTERERIADKRVSGVFTGSYAVNPISGTKVPIWISDYVLAGYGTGAIMAVPAHDSRDFSFAKKFDLPIIQVVVPEGEKASDPSAWTDAIDSKSGSMINSDSLNGLSVSDAIQKAKEIILEKRIGRVKVNYRLRDAIFSRQRYWGEPFPIYYKDGIPYPVEESLLPLCLPEVDKFLPTENGEPPLGRAKGWHTADGYPFELSTMPGFAGSSAYYLRYMDPRNKKTLVGAEANSYWKHVDLYIGGTEHATGHLIYSRFWNKFLYDLGIVCEAEPFRKLVNQGMIQGRSSFVYRVKDTNKFVSFNLKDQYEVSPIHVDISLVKNDVLDTEAFKQWRPDFASAEFILEDGKYVCGWAVEKMSKSMFNVINPDDIIERYGADTLRMYEMFLGPLEQSKPWDTNGIDGVHRFLKKFWALYCDENGLRVDDSKPTVDELKLLHKLIKKVGEDIEQFSFNTSVPAFMITVTELGKLGCRSVEILRPMLILLSPFAPHIAEELWQATAPESGGEQPNSIVDAHWPVLDESLLVEKTICYPVSFNGKVRFNIDLDANLTKEQIEAAALTSPNATKWLDSKSPKKVIVVPGRIINIVI
ncbi:MAG: leucine--tRNA ligase [Porphyromonas sp.]|nr:leucine--tRNA ligase [Porphyromonas sp.]